MEPLYSKPIENKTNLLPVSIILLVVTLAFTVPILMGGIKSMAWPRTDGIIEKTSTNYDQIFLSRRVSVNFHVNYKYNVNSKEYLGTKIQYSELSNIDHSKSYTKGDKVKVYYNPQNPNEAVLINSIHWIDLSICGGLLLAAVVFFISSVKKLP